MSYNFFVFIAGHGLEIFIASRKFYLDLSKFVILFIGEVL
jgi:hypothetical protein